MSQPQVPTLKEQLVREACAMVRRLLASGTRVPPSLVHATEQFESALAQDRPVDMMALASTHERLSRLVAPAKPGTLQLLDDSFHRAGRWSTLGPVRQVHQLVRVAVGCVAVFILLSVLQLVEAHPDIALFGDDHRYLVLRIVLERVFWLSAAGIGASFAILFQLNDLIVTRTYDPDEAASYWVKFFLGVVAGFILVALVPVDAAANTGAEALGPPTVALLGGFSASAVYRILTRLVEALESVFSGGARDQAVAAEKAAVVRASEESTQARVAVAGQLVKIQQRLVSGLPVDQANAELQGLVDSLVPSGAGAPPSSPTPVDAAPTRGRVPALAVVSDAVPDTAAEPVSAGPAQADAAPKDAPDAAESAQQPREAAGAVG